MADIASSGICIMARRACFVYTTPPPRYQAEAPGTASSAAEISPPDEVSAMAMVSRRALSAAPMRSAMGMRAFMDRHYTTGAQTLHLRHHQRAAGLNRG